MRDRLYSIHLLLILFSALSLKVHSQDIFKGNYVPPVQKQTTYNSVTIIQNIRYSLIPEFVNDSISDRILDLYLPKKVVEKELLAVVYLHGGDKGMLEFCSKISNSLFLYGKRANG